MRNFRSNATFCKMICHAQRRGIVVVYFSFPAHPLGPRYGMRKLVAISLATCLPNRHRSGTIRTCRRNNKKKKKTVIRYFFFIATMHFFGEGRAAFIRFERPNSPAFRVLAVKTSPTRPRSILFFSLSNPTPKGG